MAVLDRADWPPLPPLHGAFVDRVLEALPGDDRIVGIAIGGSFVTGGLDAMSDLDFVIAVAPEGWPDILEDRLGIARGLGTLLAAFPGDHVGEPRLLVTLYGPPLLHVDLKFVSLEDAGARVEDPAILWEREGRLSEVLSRSEARFPGPDRGWIEDRFWIWVHYTAGKVERGELFEALEALGYFRLNVLGPLALETVGHPQPQGVRRIERLAPDFAARLAASVARLDPGSCLEALEAVIDLYLELRDADGVDRATDAQRETRRYVAELGRRFRPG